MKHLRVGFVVSVALALVACSKTPPPPEPVRAVKLMTVAPSGLTAQEVYAGEVRAQVESAQGFRVGGKVLRRHVEAGQPVKAGQLLMELDPADLRLAAEAGQAQVAAATTQRDLVAADLKRYRDLRAQGFISGAELERREASLAAAEASLRQAMAQASVQGNQAGYAQLRADGDGVVLSVGAEPGQVVSAGAPVVRIARDGVRDVVFGVPEDRVASVRVGDRVQVQLWASHEAPLEAVVREVAASADPAGRTFQVRVALPADARVVLGATARVSFGTHGEALQAIRLPTSALARVGNDTVVWVFDPQSNTVQPRPVQVAMADGNDVVLQGGVQPGEEIVAAGVHVLTPGQQVARFGASRPTIDSLPQAETR